MKNSRSLILAGTIGGAFAASLGCNSNHLVNGATCQSGSGVMSSDAPFRPTNVPVFHPSTQAATGGADAQSLLDAMDVTAAANAEGITINAPSLSDVAAQGGVFNGLGSLHPVNGASFAWLSTGIAGSGTSSAVDPSGLATQIGNDMSGAGCSGVSNSHDCVTLTFSFQAPSSAHSVAFDFDFMSSEYPEFVGQGYNDAFHVSESSPSNTFSNVVYDHQNHEIDIDSVLFNQSCNDLVGTGFDLGANTGSCDAGGTGVLTTQAPVEPGENVTLTFQLYDMTDGIYDSAVMLDNFRFDAQPVGTPNTGTPTPTPEASPTPTPDPCAT